MVLAFLFTYVPEDKTMNIFAYDPSPFNCAMWLDDKRKNKMILETAQLLCGAIRFNMGPEWVDNTGLSCYRTTHVNHPCAKWTRASIANYSWLTVYYNVLLNQWGKPHGCDAVSPIIHRAMVEMEHPNQKLTPFVNCTTYKQLPVHEAYRLYHSDKWNTEHPTWNKGVEPTWRKH